MHYLIEQKKGHQFILTGSSARKLKRSGVALLAGRALLKFMNPFVAAKLGSSFSLEKALEFGMLPLVWDNTSPQSVLIAYAALYLKEEIQAEGLVAQHLKAWIDDQQEDYALTFWRTRGGSEVDFVLYGKDCFVAIEVKNGQAISRTDLSGLKAFKEDYPEAKLFFFTEGKDI